MEGHKERRRNKNRRKDRGKKQSRKKVEGMAWKKMRIRYFQPTWDPCHPSVQPGASCSDLVGPSLSQGPHSELEGAPRDVLAPVFNVHNVRPHLLRDEADTVGAVLSSDDLCVLHLPTGTRHLSRHLLVTGFTCRTDGRRGRR